MKKIIVSILFLAGISHFSFGQNSKMMSSENKGHPNFKNATPEAAAKWIVNFYADALNLNAAQKQAIYKPILQSQKELAAATATDQQAATILTSHYYMQEEFKNIFTYTQYLKYELMDNYPDGVENPNAAINKTND